MMDMKAAYVMARYLDEAEQQLDQYFLISANVLRIDLKIELTAEVSLSNGGALSWAKIDNEWTFAVQLPSNPAQRVKLETAGRGAKVAAAMSMASLLHMLNVQLMIAQNEMNVAIISVKEIAAELHEQGAPYRDQEVKAEAAGSLDTFLSCDDGKQSG